MAQNKEKEETRQLKVPETLSLCTPSIPSTPTTNQITPDEHRPLGSQASDVSDLKTDVSVDSRPTTGISPENTDLPTVPTVDDDLSKSRRREVNRCSGCRRKVGLMGFRCRCGDVFCSDHRYSDRHDCSYDYKSAGREAIARENPVVRAAKILKV
uniref:zinc finger A20 and AN1 domain-containing stress-associated protein 5-like n=1 Tax=Erigeron canadensis TaxID=72917 RepID=UPI001CB98C16|nr:zinc finger A20 and AN1 domain-containing stress-associated protein 5-like [Erigeron canadensis]